MGGMFHGGTALGGGVNNGVKSIQTRSGHRLVFTEDESILLTDKSGNQIRFDTKGSNISITPPETLTIKSKNLKLDIGENIETKAGVTIDTQAGKDIKTIAREEITQDSGKKTIISAGTNTEISAKAHLDLYGKEKFICYTDGQTELGAKDRMHVYGGNSLLTAKDKIEYKAPQMNKIPQNGEFEYRKEKQILDAKWIDSEAEEIAEAAFLGDKMSMLVFTRNFEEGETVNIDVEDDINGIIKQTSYAGTVDKDGYAILKQKVEIKYNEENEDFE